MKIECKLYQLGVIKNYENTSVIKIVVKPNSNEYPEFLPMEIAGFRANLLEGVNEGDDLIVFCGLRCRVFKEKYFLSISVTKIIKK